MHNPTSPTVCLYLNPSKALLLNRRLKNIKNSFGNSTTTRQDASILAAEEEELSRVDFPCLPTHENDYYAPQIMSTEDRKTLTVFTLMDEHVEVHGFLYSVRINGEVVDVKKKTSVLSRGPLKPKPYSGVPSLLSSSTVCPTLSSALPSSSSSAPSDLTPVPPPPPPGAPRWHPSDSWSTPRSWGPSSRPPPPARWTSRFSVDKADGGNGNKIVAVLNQMSKNEATVSPEVTKSIQQHL